MPAARMTRAITIATATAIAIATFGLPIANADTQEIQVYMHEYSGGFHLLPESIHAKVGDVLKLTVNNQGESPHNFRVCGDPTSPSEQCNDVWGFTGMIDPNGTAPLTVTVKKAGTFDYYCYIPGHKTGGMKGQLIVADAGSKTVPFDIMPLLAGLALATIVLRRRTS